MVLSCTPVKRGIEGIIYIFVFIYLTQALLEFKPGKSMQLTTISFRMEKVKGDSICNCV